MIWIIGRGVYALNFIRSLDEKHIGLITTDKEDIAACSKYLDIVLYLKAPKRNKSYHEQVKIIIKNNHCIAIGEEVMFVGDLSTYHMSPQYLHRLHHKKVFLDMIQYSWKPETRMVNDITLDEIPEKDAVIKQVNSRGMLGTLIKENGKVHDRFGNHLSNDTVLNDSWVVQQFLGKPTKKNHLSSFTYAQKGEILAHVVYKGSNNLYGFSTKRQLVVNVEINEMVSEFISGVKFSGFIGFDFILFEEHPYVIECNPRVTNGISFFNEFSLDKKSVPEVATTITTVPYLKTNWSMITLIKAKKDLWKLTDPYPSIYASYVLGKTWIWSWITWTSMAKAIEDKVISSIVTFPPQANN